MKCLHPINGWYSRKKTALGKRAVVFNPSEGYADMPVKIACGQCINCKLNRAQGWAIRCMNEASLHEKNSFITLTYNEKNLPSPPSLVLEDWQKFVKRLRKKIGIQIRFFHSGEYGSLYRRPHYHAVIFGYDFPDKTYFKTVHGGHKLYVSEELAQLWPYGIHSIGNVTHDSVNYVARYCLKKLNGKLAEISDHYIHSIDYETGEIQELKPEYSTMSRRPGVGKKWLEKYYTDVYNHDYLIAKEKKYRPPKYYDNLYELIDSNDLKKIKYKRIAEAKKSDVYLTSDRIETLDTIARLKHEKLIRALDQTI